MDLRNLCQKIDMDSIKAKLPPLPQLPALPQLKLPKSLPKLKSRKIFRSSRENVAAGIGSNESGKASPRSQATALQQQQQQQQHTIPIPPSEFINHTPARISTISSLMHEHGQDTDAAIGGIGGGNRNTYRSACSIDDDYPSPTMQQYTRASRPISPIRLPDTAAVDDVGDAGNAANRMTFTEKLQKGYKDISEFRLKHIFAKKTVVRKDNIKVDDYVLQYDEERRREQLEQERRDRKIADNYKINFMLSNTRQNTIESNDSLQGTPRAAPTAPKPPKRASVADHSGDESGMETTPPTRQPGIAATRFARVRSPPLKMPSMEQDDVVVTPPTAKPQTTTKSTTSGYRQQLSRLKGYMSSSREEVQTSSHEDAAAADEQQQAGAAPQNRSAKLLSKLPSLGRNKQQQQSHGETQPQQSEQETERNDRTQQSAPLGAIKQNLKRLQKSIKRKDSQEQQQKSNKAAGMTTDESDNEEEDAKQQRQQATKQKTTKASRAKRLSAQLRRFRSSEEVTNTTETAGGEATVTTTATGIGSKLQNWKKSFKKSASEAPVGGGGGFGATTGDESSPEAHGQQQQQQEKRSGTLMKKLKYIRSRKTTNSHEDDLDGGEPEQTADEQQDNSAAKNKTGGRKMTSHLEERFTHARNKTMKKVNEKMQQIKFFHKSQEQVDKQQHEQEQEQEQEQQYAGGKTATPINKIYYQHRTATESAGAVYHDGNDDDDDDEYHHNSSDNDETWHDIASASSPKATHRHYGQHRVSDTQQQYNADTAEIEEINRIQTGYAHAKRRNGISSCDVVGGGGVGASSTLTAWTTKPILCEESFDSDTESEFPRVLIHQDNSDAFESTLIIAVTRPATVSPSPRISEIITEKRAQTPPPAIGTAAASARQWISNEKIISGFLEVTPPPAAAATKRRAANKPSHESNAERERSVVAEIKTDPWHVQTTKEDSKEKDAQILYKTRSIDIFEANVKGGMRAAFEDFDDELRNEPIVRIAGISHLDSFERESSEDPDAADDDDNSSRVTKIRVQAASNSSSTEHLTTAATLVLPTATTKLGNSRESLITQQQQQQQKQQQIDGKKRAATDDDEDENDDDEDVYGVDDDDDDDAADADDDSIDNGDEDETENDRPPSAAPSPPPSHSPPPPPLPERRQPPAPQSMQRPLESPLIPPEDYDDLPPPPLPTTRPPLAAPLPKIPERTASMTRPAKPLVKTSSLRLAYSEQVKPGDVGKVNKLISRFEKPGTKSTGEQQQQQQHLQQQRPRIMSRRLQSQESEECSDDGTEESTSSQGTTTNLRDITPTPQQQQQPTQIRTTNTTTATAIKGKDTTAAIRSQQQQQQRQRQAASTSIVQQQESIPVQIPQIVTTHDITNNNSSKNKTRHTRDVIHHSNEQHQHQQQQHRATNVERHASDISKSTLSLDRKNSNCSRSEYGSPLAYPSSLRGSNETTPVPERRQQQQQQQQLQLQEQRLAQAQARRSRRSMTRDDDNFYSFDSDEENSYYSISPSGSSRYVVEI